MDFSTQMCKAICQFTQSTRSNMYLYHISNLCWNLHHLQLLLVQEHHFGSFFPFLRHHRVPWPRSGQPRSWRAAASGSRAPSPQRPPRRVRGACERQGVARGQRWRGWEACQVLLRCGVCSQWVNPLHWGMFCCTSPLKQFLDMRGVRVRCLFILKTGPLSRHKVNLSDFGLLGSSGNEDGFARVSTFPQRPC